MISPGIEVILASHEVPTTHNVGPIAPPPPPAVPEPPLWTHAHPQGHPLGPDTAIVRVAVGERVINGERVIVHPVRRDDFLADYCLPRGRNSIDGKNVNAIAT